MKPIEFKQQNCVFAKDQKDYKPLPAFMTKDGMVVSCWRLSFAERLRVLLGRRIWVVTRTFRQSLQPQWLQVHSPFTPAKKGTHESKADAVG